MSITFEVEFIGGPMDGSRRAVEAEPSGPFVQPKPPFRVTFEIMGAPTGPTGHIIPIEQVHYYRRLNDRDEGTLYEYVWLAPPSL